MDLVSSEKTAAAPSFVLTFRRHPVVLSASQGGVLVVVLVVAAVAWMSILKRISPFIIAR